MALCPCKFSIEYVIVAFKTHYNVRFIMFSPCSIIVVSYIYICMGLSYLRMYVDDCLLGMFVYSHWLMIQPLLFI